MVRIKLSTKEMLRNNNDFTSPPQFSKKKKCAPQYSTESEALNFVTNCQTTTGQFLYDQIEIQWRCKESLFPTEQQMLTVE